MPANTLQPYNWTIAFEPYGKGGDSYKNVRLRDTRTGRFVSQNVLRVESEQARMHSVRVARLAGRSPNDESTFLQSTDGLKNSGLGDAYGDRWDQIANEAVSIIAKGDDVTNTPTQHPIHEIIGGMTPDLGVTTIRAGALALAAA